MQLAMNRPIRAGDTARIVQGTLGTQGPNVGKTVRVGLLAGEHSVHGNIWSVHGTGLVTEYGAVGDTLHCAQGWLQRIEPPKIEPKGADTRIKEKA